MISEIDEIIQKLVQNDASLAVLDCRQMGLSGEKSAEIFKALENNTVVTELKYLGNHCSGDAAKALSSLLKQNHTLEVLELGTNQLTNEDMIHIVEGLLENNSVTKIDLNSNLFDKPDSIAKLLEHSTLLKEIDLTFSNISEEGFIDILVAFQRNQHSSLTVFNVYFPPLACLNDFQLLCQDNASRLESTYRPT